MITFEITLLGFDGRTDATDHLVRWVNATDRVALDRWLDENSLDYHLACEPRDLNESGCVPPGAGRRDGVDFVFDESDPAMIAEWKHQSFIAICQPDP